MERLKSAVADAGAPGADGGSTLPPGHPPVEPEESDGLPQGHPPVNDIGEDGPDPHGAPPPRTRGEGLGEAPTDSIQEDRELPPGTIVVSVKDVGEKPVPRAPLKLSILHSSVAKGDSREERTAQVDEQGTYRFDNMPIGSGTQYRAITTRGPAAYAVGPFVLTDTAGKRVVLHSYEVATDIGEVLVGMQGMVYVSLREDSLSVEHLFNVFNLGPVAWVPNITIELPEGWKAFNKPDSAEEGVRFEEVKDQGAALRGTIGPGRHDTNFRYQVPLSGSDRQTLRIELPPRVAQARVIAEASKSMGLEVTGFPSAQQTKGRDGKRLLVTDRQVSRDESGVKVLEITITGLPTPGPGRWIALGLAVTAFLGAGAYVLQRRESHELADDAREDLVEAREALLREIVELERAHRRGDVGPKTYARIRHALMDSLARIVTMLEGDQTPAAGALPKRPASATPR